MYYLFAIFKNILIYRFLLMLLCQIVIDYVGMIDSYIKARIKSTHRFILIIICIMLEHFSKLRKTKEKNGFRHSDF